MEQIDLNKELESLLNQKDKNLKDLYVTEGALQVIQYLIQREAELKAAETVKDAEVME